MRPCEEYQPLISAMLDGELTEAELAEANAHIASCPDCRAMYEAFAAVSAMEAEELPEALHAAVMAKVGAAKKAMHTQRTLLRLRPILTAAACLAVMVGTLFAVKNVLPRSKTADSTEMMLVTDAAAGADTAEAPKMMMAPAAPAAEEKAAVTEEAPAEAEPVPAPETVKKDAVVNHSIGYSSAAEEPGADSSMAFATLRITAMTDTGFTAVDTDTAQTAEVLCDDETETAPELGKLLPDMVVSVGYTESGDGVPMLIRAEWIGPSE